jgi:adenosylcobinamide-GDP ribazoletransferase
MIGRLLGAFQFLTVLPIRRATAAAGESALFFPLVGWALGFAGGLLLQSTRTFIPTPLASLVVLAFWAFLTGALHEDGFADVFDGFRAGRPRERILAILKDSRIGAHGALALVLVTVLRWQALISFVGDPVRSLSAIFAVSRASIAALAWISPPAGDGLGFEFSRTLTGAIVMGAILQALFFACFGGAALLLCGGTVLIVLAARRYFVARIGGVTGDCLGATGFLVETWGFVLFACQRCM